MADILTTIGVFFSGFLNALVKNAVLIGILAVIGFAIYLYFNKEKKVDIGYELFKKQYDTTAERLKLSTPKVLALCSYPQTVEELKKLPMYQIQHQPFGEVVGVNVYPVITTIESLVKLAHKPDSKTLDDLLKQVKEENPKEDQWIVFAIKKKVGGKWLFPEVKESLVWIKQNQLINFNSNDKIIRVRGFGVGTLGFYEYVR